MTLKTKVGCQLFGGVLAVLVLSQAVQFFHARRANHKLGEASEALLQERELQNVNGGFWPAGYAPEGRARLC